MTASSEQLGEQEPRLGTYQRDMNDTNHITDSIIETCLRVTGMPCLQIPPNQPSHSELFTNTHTHTYPHPMAGSLCVLPIVVRATFGRQIVSTCSKQA